MTVEIHDDCAHCGRFTLVKHTGKRWLCNNCWKELLGGSK